jgi:hypothetical protein
MKDSYEPVCSTQKVFFLIHWVLRPWTLSTWQFYVLSNEYEVSDLISIWKFDYLSNGY